MPQNRSNDLSNKSALNLSSEEIHRYSRQIILPEVGLDGQRALKSARVLVIGAGGLGSPVLLYLAAAGVGTLGIVEFDTVDPTNLHRQIIFDSDDIGQPKLRAAERRIQKQNPFIRVEAHSARLTIDNALELIDKYDIVIDATDNFPTRYLINDACVMLGKPNVSASIYRFEGQLSVFWPNRGPCYRCLFPEPPPAKLAPSCAEGGVLGVLPGVVGGLQANEAIKIILGKGTSLIGRLLLFDALEMHFREFAIERVGTCSICSMNGREQKLIAYENLCSLGKFSVVENTTQPSAPTISAKELKAALDRNDLIEIVDVRNAPEHDLARIPGSLLLPLAELEDHLDELPREGRIVCYCHTGKRSQRAALLLRESGFAEVVSLEGGIDAWSKEVDSGVPRY